MTIRQEALFWVWRHSGDHAVPVRGQYSDCVARASSARDCGQQSTLNDVQTIENIRFQMMENRLFLGTIF